MVLSCSSKATEKPEAQPQEKTASTGRNPAPDFTLQDANGNSVKLSDAQGKVVLLNFWATWCGPCQLEIPWFIAFQQEYKSKGLEVIGVAMDEEGWKVIKPYVNEHKMNYRVVLGNDSVTQLYGGVDSLPTTFIIDRSGKIAYVHVGLAGRDEYRNEIQTLLGIRPGGANSAHLQFPAAVLKPGAAK